MMRYIFLSLIILAGCREFYDEEFLEFEREQTRTSGGTADDVSYSADLNSTDPNLPALSGNVKIDIQNNEVSVDLDVDNIPANIIQIHYGYIAAGCDQLNIAIPNENTTTRKYTVAEETSVNALANDLKSSGASTNDGDINLTGKKFIVKAFSNFSGIPNPSGTNQITILCGEIQLSRRNEDVSDIGTTGTTNGVDGVVTTTTTGGF